MALLYDCSDETKRTRGMGVAVRAIKAGRLVVLPTDTVYGVGADAFSPDAVAKLLAAKGRGPDMPVPVLVGSADAWTGIAVTNEAAEALAAVFWPGGLSLLCYEQPSLNWNLGDTGGTVVVRMPEDDVALELLRKTGPMGVSSANLSGQPPARSAQQARDQLGDSVAVYLEAGLTAADVPSTIVDVTEEIPRVVRLGAVSLDRLREVVPEIIGPDEGIATDDDAGQAEPPYSVPEDSEPEDSEPEDSEPEDSEPEDSEPEGSEPEDETSGEPGPGKPVQDGPAQDEAGEDTDRRAEPDTDGLVEPDPDHADAVDVDAVDAAADNVDADNVDSVDSEEAEELASGPRSDQGSGPA